MSQVTTTTAPATATVTTATRVAITSDETRILTSRMGSAYARPVYHTVTVPGVSVSITALPLLVIKRDNIRDSDGVAVPVGQCAWAITARVDFYSDSDSNSFRGAMVKAQTEGDTPILEVATGEDDNVLTCYYAHNTIGVSPAKGRRDFAVGLAVCFAEVMSEANAHTLRDGIAGEAPKRAGVDTAGIKAAAAAEALATAFEASVAAMVAFGIPLATAQALARGQAVAPAPAPDVKTGGRK